MIFAQVDVELRDHERAHRAGAAMATWSWALLWTRAKERDGFVAVEALRGAWVGEKQATRDMAKLCEVGLAEVVDGGWTLLRYAEKNETRTEIDARRAASAKRKRDFDARRRNASNMVAGDGPVTRYSRVGNTTEPEPEPEPEPDPPKPPEGAAISEPVRKATDPELARVFGETYREGIVDGLRSKGEPSPGLRALDWKAARVIGELVEQHVLAAGLEAATKWTRTMSARFVAAQWDARQFQRGWHPEKFAEWLAAGCPSATPKATPRNVGPIVQQPPEGGAHWKVGGT